MAGDADAWFHDKTVLLAGATGELGAVVAKRLLAAGAKLALTVRKPWQLGALAEALGVERAGGRTLLGVVGSADGEAAAGFVKGVRDALGPIDALLVTIGAFAAAEVGKDQAELAHELLLANYLAPLTLARAVVPAMKRRGAGSIVFTGARAVGTAVPGLAHYLAAKSALHSFAACLHAELAASGIGVAVVAPAALATDSNRRSSPKDALVPLELVASTMLEAAAGRLGGGAPLYRLPPEG